MTNKNLVLRTVYLNPSVDNQLRDEAFETRQSKNDLIRRYLAVGMQVLSKVPSLRSVETDELVTLLSKYAEGKADPADLPKPAAKKAEARKAPAKKAATQDLAVKVTARKKVGGNAVRAKKAAGTKAAA